MKIETLSRKRHNEFHRPYINDKEVQPAPYLTLPFVKQELKKSAMAYPHSGFNQHTLYHITEGWEYSMRERTIHGWKKHRGIDYFVPEGTPVVAPCDGLAMSSYHAFYVTGRSGEEKRYQGKEVGMGLGLFVQIWTPDNRIVQLAHLSAIADHIPFSLPEQDEVDKLVWTPQNHTLNITERLNSQFVIPVRRGDPIGEVGTSGLRLGKYQELIIDSNDRPKKIPIALTQASWDEPHLHFEEAQRDEETGVKGWQRDPYDAYLTGRYYPTHNKKGKMGQETLFELDKSELPKFTD